MSPAPTRTNDALRVIISGASSGIGTSLAHYYARQGAELGLIARRAGVLEQLAASLSTPCAVYPLDVRDGAGLLRAGQDFISRFGCPDVVIANAGINAGTSTEQAADLAVIQEVIQTNVLGIVHTLHPFIACMRKRGRGALVGIASVAGYRGLPGVGAYSASKAAAISYLESLRAELRGTGIRVITVCPGYIATPMTDDNPYPMPFLMTSDRAAEKIATLIRRGRTYAVIPWQMALVARILHIMPNWLYDLLFAHAARKPRRKG